MYELTKLMIKRSKKEFIFKVITSLFLRGLLLIVPIFWSKVINNVSEGMYSVAYKLVIVTLVVALFYYLFQYLNQASWFKLYNKLYMEYTNVVLNDNKINNLSVGEYTNIINTDIDIICTFIGNMVTRMIQILEFFFIYLYFLSINSVIFIVTVVLSVVMFVILFSSGNLIQEENLKRKEALDRKTVTTHRMYEMVRDHEDMKEINKNFKSNAVTYLRNNRKFNLLSSFFTYFILGFLELCRYGIIFYSISLVTKNVLEVGTVLLVYSYYDKILANFEVLGTINAEYQSFVVSLKRLNKVGS